MYEFVHTTWSKCCSDSVHNRHTRIDVTDELCFALAGICTFLEQNDLWLLQKTQYLIIWLIIAELGVEVSLHVYKAQ